MDADAESAKVIDIAAGRLAGKDRERYERAAQAKAEGKIALHTRHDAVAWGDAWHAEARRWQAIAERMSMLCQIAEIHEKASELLREHAEAELRRVTWED